jgi:hypothetical protein
MITTKQRLRLMDLEDKLEACRKSLTLCNLKLEVEEWVDTKLLIREVQREMAELKKLQSA